MSVIVSTGESIKPAKENPAHGDRNCRSLNISVKHRWKSVLSDSHEITSYAIRNLVTEHDISKNLPITLAGNSGNEELW